MKLKYLLLAGIVAPGFLILPIPAEAQNCPPPKRIVNGQCVNPPPAAPAPVRPAPPVVQQPKPQQPAIVQQPKPPQPTVVQQPKQQQIQQGQPQGQPPIKREQFRQVQPQGNPPGSQPGLQPQPKQFKPVQQGQPVIQPQNKQVNPQLQPQGQPPIKQVNPQIQPQGQPQLKQVNPQIQPQLKQVNPQVAPQGTPQGTPLNPALTKTGQPPLQPATPQIAPVITATPPNARKLEDFRAQRKETKQGNATVVQEPGRTIIKEGNRFVIQRNESDRFRKNARNVSTERRGADTATIIDRANGARIVTLTDANGRLLRRSRRDASGREIVLIDNTRHHGGAIAGVAIGAAAIAGLVILSMRPPVIHMPRDRYIVEAERADRRMIYEALMAPPVEVLDRDYSLDEIRYNVELRDRMPRIDIDTITFDFGSWEVTPDQAQRLSVIAEGLQDAIAQNPSAVFLIEGHTDAVGTDFDNLSLSDRRAEAVAQVLTDMFNIPPENLTTQGYGEQFLKIPTPDAERRNRRVAIRAISPLLNGPTAQNPQ